MSHEFTLSKKGRRLIKAFEGFRPVDRVLVSGQRIVGYGHKVRRPEPMVVTRTEANALLKEDLGPYEEMINAEVHAPLNQNQFDALVSLAFSIGPKAFLQSPTLHLLNNGRPLDAARSFEIWRKSRVDGRTYIIDALVRRRAMEKALFLRPVAGIITASRVSLPAVEDSALANRIWDDDLPVFESPAEGYVTQVPYDQTGAQENERPIAVPSRRREDGPAGILTLSEVYDETVSFNDDENDVIEIDDIVPETDGYDSPSPIAVAAAEVSERLDALMGKTVETEIPQDEVDTNWPESLIVPEDSVDDLALGDIEPEIEDISDAGVELQVQAELESEPEPAPQQEAKPKSLTREAPAVLYSETETETYNPNLLHLDPVAEPRGLGPYFVMIVTGFTLVGASLGAIAKSGVTQFGGPMPFWPALGVILGALILLFAFYYVLKAIFRRE